MRQLILLCVFVVVVFTLHAQNFGGNPASVKWQQINTDAVKVIYPKGMDSSAARVATISYLLQNKYCVAARCEL
jgi:alkyl sulfatase BDS1-like metallo-beta-lactamase superfamily hydrolase